MDLLSIVVQRGPIVHAPGAPLPGGPTEANGCRSHLSHLGGAGEGEGEMGKVNDVHDPCAISWDEGFASIREGERSGEAQGAEKGDSRSMDRRAAVQMLQRVTSVWEIADKATVVRVGEEGGSSRRVFHAVGGDQGIREEEHEVESKVGGKLAANRPSVYRGETCCFTRGIRASRKEEATLEERGDVQLVGIAPVASSQEIGEKGRVGAREGNSHAVSEAGGESATVGKNVGGRSIPVVLDRPLISVRIEDLVSLEVHIGGGLSCDERRAGGEKGRIEGPEIFKRIF